MVRYLICLSLLAAAPQLAWADENGEAEQPRQIGLVERAGKRLAQLDISVSGPPELVATLTADDFRIKINFKRLKDFQLDRLCGVPEGETSADPTTPAVASASLRATYLFYIDQPHLTMAGRQAALDLTRKLIDELLDGTSQAMIVSNARRLTVIEPLTTDRERLLDAVERLEHDRDQWDFAAEQETSRVAEVVRRLNEFNGVDGAVSLARTYQKEERWRTERNLRRLEATLGGLSEVAQPKAAFYFADTMRANPGEHFLSFFGSRMLESDPALSVMAADVTLARVPFDRVVNAASADGIRFYPVRAQGLISRFEPLSTSVALNTTLAKPSSSRLRHNHARDSMSSMASETGGRAFLFGEKAVKIAERIAADFSCLYLASFDPANFKEDAPLRVKVELEEREELRRLDVHTRGRIVLQSESRRTTARLLSAFSSPETGDEVFAVQTNIVPSGFRDGVYRGMLQIRVPPTSLSGATWDLGVSVVSRDKVRDEASGRVSVDQPGVAVIFERKLEFKPGDYEITIVAHETSTGLVSSGQLEVRWPRPNAAEAFISPIVLLQPSAGAFLRDGRSRTQGSLARSATEPLVTDRPAALVGLVCRSRRQKGALSVERSLVGISVEHFPPLVFDLEEDRCAQLRDVLPSGSLGPGFYRYEVRVSQDAKTLSQAELGFMAVQPGT